LSRQKSRKKSIPCKNHISVNKGVISFHFIFALSGLDLIYENLILFKEWSGKWLLVAEMNTIKHFFFKYVNMGNSTVFFFFFFIVLETPMCDL